MADAAAVAVFWHVPLAAPKEVDNFLVGGRGICRNNIIYQIEIIPWLNPPSCCFDKKLKSETIED